VITFDPDAVSVRITALEEELGQPGFWDDQSHAARVSTEHSRLTKRLERYERLQREHDDAAELLAMDPDLGDEIEAQLQPLRGELARLQEDALFTGEYDSGDAVASIHSGTGGTDAQDWAEMMLRMYLRWADDRGFQAELIEASPGEEAGLKSATFTVKAPTLNSISLIASPVTDGSSLTATAVLSSAAPAGGGGRRSRTGAEAITDQVGGAAQRADRCGHRHRRAGVRAELQVHRPGPAARSPQHA